MYIFTGTEKPLLWVGSALEDLRAFPEEARREAGFELYLVQCGLEPSDWKSMASVGAGVAERREDAMTIKVTRTKGNVFATLGFGAEEAANLRLRAELMVALRELIERRGLTQAKAASALGVTQPRISDLVRGKLDRFSVDTLIAMLGHAGAQVTVSVRSTSKVA